MKHFVLISFVLLTITVTFANENLGDTKRLQLTAEQTEALIERAMEESAAEDDDCSNKTLTTCMGITRSTCESLRNSVISECTMPLARQILSSDGELTENIEFEHSKCSLELGESRYSIKAEKHMACMPRGTYQNPDRITEWLESR